MKRRLVGALVIVLLAIILVPAWLDGSARRLRDEGAFVVPLPPPDNRKAMVDPETIGEPISNEVPKLDPLPEPAPIAEEVKAEIAAKEQAAAEQAEAAKQAAAEAAAKAASTASSATATAVESAKTVAAEVVPDPVEVDLNAAAAGSASDTATNAAPAESIAVEVAESVKTAERANWIVQVGSFASQENAAAMVNRLKKGELKAFMRDFKSNGDSIYRVLVGPFVRQTEADDAKRTIDRRFQVKSFVANWRD